MLERSSTAERFKIDQPRPLAQTRDWSVDLFTGTIPDDDDEKPDKTVTLAHLAGKDRKFVIDAVRNWPIFWRAMSSGESIDPLHLNSLMTLLKSASGSLSEFLRHMTLELSLSAAIEHCQSVADVENELMRNLPLRSVIFWVRPSGADFLVSPTTHEVVPTDASILGFCLANRRCIVTGDPADHPGFNLDWDLTLLRGATSMALLPVTTPMSSIGVIQCIDYFDVENDTTIQFSKYIIRLLKLARDAAKRILFEREESSLFLTGTIAELMSKFQEDQTLLQTVQQISKFLCEHCSCESADVYEYDRKNNKLVDMKSGAEFGDLSTGGVSLMAALKKKPVWVAHGISKMDMAAVDVALTNKSALAVWFSRESGEYVLTVRAKWQEPSFDPADLKRVMGVGPALCDAIGIAKFAKGRSSEVMQLRRNLHVSTTVCDILQKLGEGEDCWKLLNDAAQSLFECDACFVCVFDGLNMKFLRTAVARKIDECIAGKAYNYREVVVYDRNERVEDFYEQLGVMNRYSVAFPFSVNGNVAGAIEIINPGVKVDVEGQAALASLCSLIIDVNNPAR